MCTASSSDVDAMVAQLYCMNIIMVNKRDRLLNQHCKQARSVLSLSLALRLITGIHVPQDSKMQSRATFPFLKLCLTEVCSHES